MSTRSNIIVLIDEQKIVLYHHHDGYVEGVGFDLVERMNRVLYNEWQNADDLLNDLLKDKNDEYEFSTASGLHGDIEYLYEVDCEARTVKGWRMLHDWKLDTMKRDDKEIDVVAAYNKSKKEA